MIAVRGRFTVSGELDTARARTELAEVASDPLFYAQKPYRNGIVVYAKSVWGGNGFGNTVSRVAVRNGEVVAFYESETTHQLARVAGVGDIYSDGAYFDNGNGRRRVVTATALSKWIATVKGL